MSTEHTPGPWKLADSDDNIIVGAVTRYKNPTPKGINLACVAIVDDSSDEYEDMANARLLAAAPELLAACEYVLPHLEEYVKWHHAHAGGCSVEMEQARDNVRDAIKKARGK